ncbi:lipopolysaccharide-induced tumor necrosis factor-alpha factor homolog isoform X1 [Megalops cyprinoides]|uniref:lipopolysaccharide-induced tumor necrosis factor-alpha factor homolog isoform X1 n=2 Tax=Megalops cyprinoides TaxID=118141 RepID=UPI001864D5AE|nr:lipopolysaccharide-induced tumor necrosis factor-alpha factor homolog isoform X1 [Megalops cyprinoides]
MRCCVFSPDSLLDNSAIIAQGGVFVLPPVPDIMVAPPPPMPAPQVILDPKNLPAHPSQTQCPSCHQFITTEIITKVGTVTWLACIMSAMLGCVAGCCFIPFCISNFKDIIHQCPKCRTKIHTIPKL